MSFPASGGTIDITATTAGSDIWTIALASLPSSAEHPDIWLWFHLLIDATNPGVVDTFQFPYGFKFSPFMLNFAEIAATYSMPPGYYRIEVRAYDENALLYEQPTFSSSSNLISFGVTGGGGATGGASAVCFLGNAPVLTPAGYKRIDSLAAGDMVRTADGRDVAIQRVKHQRIVSPSSSVNPYIIPAGQFGATENLAISPRHCVAIPGRGMVEARELGLRQMSMRAAFDYYNLELPEWDNMVVAGVEVESLAPTKRVTMTAAEFRGLVGGRSVDMAKLAEIARVLSDGRVEVALTRKARRM